MEKEPQRDEDSTEEIKSSSDQKCPICFEERDFVFLCCKHWLCISCAEMLFQGEALECAICRVVTKIESMTDLLMTPVWSVACWKPYKNTKRMKASCWPTFNKSWVLAVKCLSMLHSLACRQVASPLLSVCSQGLDQRMELQFRDKQIGGVSHASFLKHRLVGLSWVQNFRQKQDETYFG